MQLARILVFLILISCSFQTAFPQAITKDGSYVGVVIDKTLDRSAPVLVLQSTGKKTWKREIAGASQPVFTADDRHALYTLSDTLFIHRLGSDKRQHLPGVACYRQPNSGAGKWLACRIKDNTEELLVHDIHTGKQNKYEEVQDYFFDENGEHLFLKSRVGQENALDMIILTSGQRSRLWKGTGEPFSYVFDNSNSQLAFFVKDYANSERPQHTIWHYRTGNEQATVLVDDGHAAIDSNLVIGGGARGSAGRACAFNRNGNKLFFYLQEKELPVKNLFKSKVDVWSYLDTRNMDVQLLDNNVLRNYAAVVSLETGKLVRLEDDSILIPRSAHFIQNVAEKSSDEYTVICDFKVDNIFRYNNSGFVDLGYSFDEYNWNRTTKCDIFLVSLNDGKKTLLKRDVQILAGNDTRALPYLNFSPSGDCLVYYDPKKNAYLCFNLKTNLWLNLTRGIDKSWRKENQRFSGRYFLHAMDIFWEEKGKYLFVWDADFDIWKLDLADIKPAVNLTNGYFKRCELFPYYFALKSLAPQEQYIFTTKGKPNSINSYKTSGFFALRSDGGNELLPIGEKFQYEIAVRTSGDKGFVVSRQNQSEPLEYCYTQDFTTFVSITSSLPEKRMDIQTIRYDLFTWTTFDGRQNQGTLLFPPDFDSRKKYPVIVTYYDAPVKAPSLHQYRPITENLLDYTEGIIFFFPDIHFSAGSICDCAYNSVVSGAKHISKLPFVDSTKMGIMGESFGGFSTNCLVTRTDIFVAAYSAVGYSNMISSYLGLDIGMRRGATVAEIGQNSIGITPWERLDLYIENSPVFFAHHVSTPLLLSGGKLDNNVPHTQNMEMFKSLRRLGKRVWFFNWDDKGHEASAPWKQFFDYYLKGAPPARWMVETIPARKKGIVDPFEPVLGDRTLSPGLLSDTIIRTPRQQQLVDEKPVMYKLP